jgi:hypothetical protein
MSHKRAGWLLLTTMVLAVSSRADTPTCNLDLVTTGNFLSGHLYKAIQEFPNISTADAYKRAYANTVSGGFKISSADKEVGSISATQEVVMGNGKTSTYNILVEALPSGGSRVSVSMTAGTGMLASKAALQKQFCGLFSGIAGQ